jgi:YD repeat-containing protein
VVDEVFTSVYGTNVTGLKTKFAYDALLRPVSEQHWQTLNNGPDNLLSQHDYVRRADGKILQVAEREQSVGTTCYTTGRLAYAYDGDGRLTQEVQHDPNNVTGTMSTISYDYDLGAIVRT